MQTVFLLISQVSDGRYQVLGGVKASPYLIQMSPSVESVLPRIISTWMPLLDPQRAYHQLASLPSVIPSRRGGPPFLIQKTFL